MFIIFVYIQCIIQMHGKYPTHRNKSTWQPCKQNRSIQLQCIVKWAHNDTHVCKERSFTIYGTWSILPRELDGLKGALKKTPARWLWSQENNDWCLTINPSYTFSFYDVTLYKPAICVCFMSALCFQGEWVEFCMCSSYGPCGSEQQQHKVGGPSTSTSLPTFHSCRS